MWLPTSIIVLFVLCLECSIPLNVGASEAEMTSTLLSRVSEWDCASNTDCTIANSSCTNGYCECDGGYIYNTDMTACLLAATAYGDECIETIQCSTYLLSGSVCANGICTCNDGYHYTHGRCYASAALGEACTTDANCYVWANNEASSCVNGICECSDGFYTREYRTCRPASYAEGDSCAIDLDCQFENGYCSGSSLDAASYVCALLDPTTTTTTTPDNDTSGTEDGVHGSTTITPDNDTSGTEDGVHGSTTITPDNDTSGTEDGVHGSTTITPDNDTSGTEDGVHGSTTITPDNDTSGTEDGVHGSTTITPDNDTSGTEDGVHGSTIITPDNDTSGTEDGVHGSTTITPDNDTSGTEDGVHGSTTITPDNDTSGTEDGVHGSTTITPDNATPGTDENATVGTECVSDEDCTTLANSRCGAAGYCICKRAYYASDDFSTCIAEIGEDCSSDDDVEITNSLCLNGAWSCGHSSVASINQQICRKSTKNYDFSCLHDEQCDIFGPDASCQNKRCLCNEGSHLVEDLKFCWVSKGISESCQADEDCYVKDLDVELSCANSVCTCPNGTSPDSDKTLCKADNAALGETCEDDNDCISANSACIDSICACPESYFELDDYCAAGINATCSSDSDCDVTNSACLENNVCECSKNYVSDATDSCLPVASHGEKCQSDIQCSTVLSNTYCAVVTTTSDDGSNSNVASSCECKSDYHYRFGICNYKTQIGRSCTSLGDCYVESGIEDVVCRKGICACSWDASADGTTSCSRTGSDATTIFLSTWMSLILLSVKIFLV